MQEKSCIRCTRLLPVSQFTRDKTRPDGYFVYCKACKNEVRKSCNHDKNLDRVRQQKYRQRYPDKAREFNRAQHARNASDPEFREAARQRASSHYHSKTQEERVAMRQALAERDPDFRRKRLNQHLRKTYGLTVEQYEEMLAAQNGCCAICGTTQKTGYRRLSVDHCHATNKVRELLCHRCNMLVGFLENKEGLIEKGIAYLERHA